MKTKDFLKKHRACADGAKWALSISDDMADVWDAMITGGKHTWLIWTLSRPDVFPSSTLRKLACRLVRETPLLDDRKVWDLLTDERSRKAVEVAERYANRKATKKELANARNAARAANAAAYAAARAACAAAPAVANAAANAANAAAYAAARAATYTANAAAYAAAHAARAAAAAYAAGAAAEAAARAAARSAQIKMIADLGNPFRKEPPMSESHDNRTMQGKTGEEQAKRAIRHVLGVIRDHAEVGWYMGAGTQSFDLLTEAAATLFDEPLDKVRSYFLPLAPRDPKEDGCDKETSKYCPYCGEELENQ